LPKTTELSGRLVTTTDPAPIKLFSPMVTCGRIVTLAPILAFFLIASVCIVLFHGIEFGINKQSNYLRDLSGLSGFEYPSAADVLELFANKHNREGISLLADKIMGCRFFKTMTDNEEVFVYNEETGIYEPNGEQVIKDLCEKMIAAEATSYRTNEVINHVKRSTYSNREDFDKDKMKVVVNNGILNLETGELEPFDPEKLFIVRIPVEFAPGADCPKIKQFFKEIVVEEHIQVLEELFGYCLLRSYPIHKAFMLVGEGANGKSTFINLVKNFLGGFNCSSVSLQELEPNRFASSALFGKLANLYADLPASALSNTGRFKMLTGEDVVGAEKKFKDRFYFHNFAKLIFSANKIPISKDDTTAFWRRWVIINFPNKFEGEKADKKLLEKLCTQEELTGLLNLAIGGLKRIVEKSDFSYSLSTEEVREIYIRMSDTVGAFVFDCLVQSSDDYIVKKELYNKYCEYCREKRLPPVSEGTFHKNLHQYVNVSEFRPDDDIKRVMCWKGIRFRRPDDQPPDEGALEKWMKN